METIEVLKKYKTSKIIKLINKGKLNIEEFLMHAIGYKKNDISNYILDNYVINLEYKNKFDCDFLEAAILSGNIEIIEKLKHLGVDINKKYKYGRKNINAMIFIQDVDTFKYFENYFDKKEIKPCLDIIIKSTFTNYNVELLDYIVKNYKFNIKKIKYEINNKKYNLLEMSNELLTGMKNREYRKKETAFYLSELLIGRKYRKIIDKAFELSNEIETEIKKIEKYNKYIKKLFGD